MLGKIPASNWENLLSVKLVEARSDGLVGDAEGSEFEGQNRGFVGGDDVQTLFSNLSTLIIEVSAIKDRIEVSRR